MASRKMLSVYSLTPIGSSKMVPYFCFHYDSSIEKNVLAKEYVSIVLGKQRSRFWLMNCLLAYTLHYHELG